MRCSCLDHASHRPTWGAFAGCPRRSPARPRSGRKRISTNRACAGPPRRWDRPGLAAPRWLHRLRTAARVPGPLVQTQPPSTVPAVCRPMIREEIDSATESVAASAGPRYEPESLQSPRADDLAVVLHKQSPQNPLLAPARSGTQWAPAAAQQEIPRPIDTYYGNLFRCRHACRF